jgi:integrase
MAQRILRPRTVELYEGLLRLHILPKLGGIELGDLSPREVRAWHAGLLKQGRPSPITVAKAYRLLRTICETAVSDEMIARNPCNLKGAAVEHSPERPVLTVGEVDALVSTIEERYAAFVILAAWCSLRLGEVMALTRADIDLESGTVRVEKSAWELKSGERIVGPPKTKAGIRTVYIPPHVLPAIARHLEQFSAPGQDGLIFTGTLGQPLRRGSLYKAWARATNELGLKGIRIHDLRHTGATLAAGTGASTKELMARLGHASSDAALRYQHATKDRDEAISRALSDLARPEWIPLAICLLRTYVRIMERQYELETLRRSLAMLRVGAPGLDREAAIVLVRELQAMERKIRHLRDGMQRLLEDTDLDVGNGWGVELAGGSWNHEACQGLP